MANSIETLALGYFSRNLIGNLRQDNLPTFKYATNSVRPYANPSENIIVLPEKVRNIVDALYQATFGVGQLIYSKKNISTGSLETSMAQQTFSSFCGLCNIDLRIAEWRECKVESPIQSSIHSFMKQYLDPKKAAENQAYFELRTQPVIPTSIIRKEALTPEVEKNIEMLKAFGLFTDFEIAANYLFNMDRVRRLNTLQGDKKHVVQDETLNLHHSLAKHMYNIDPKELAHKVMKMQWIDVSAAETQVNAPSVKDDSTSVILPKVHDTPTRIGMPAVEGKK